jgi:hypothetical protein
MPNLILLAGIVIYAWKHRPPRASLTRITAPRLAAAVLAVFLVVQVKEATDFGRVNGGVIHSAWSTSARFFVNADRISAQDRSCLQSQVLFFQAGAQPSFAIRLEWAMEDRLGEFEPSSYRYYRRLGPPPLLFGCTTAASAEQP